MKKLMILGGSRYIVPVIKKAQELGIYVITCDYLPDNDAHRFSDEYVNLSVIDKDSVLDFAQKIGIDGIISFACDPGVVTAAYVAEKMHLPFQCSYESARILQDKGLFRKFLMTHEFNCPKAYTYVGEMPSRADLGKFKWPVIVKPTDSAGSKGVTKVDRYEDIQSEVETALEYSHSDSYIVEEFLTFEGYHSSADLFTEDGTLTFVTYSDQLFDSGASNPYTPAYIIWPTSMKKKYQDELTSELQRLMTLLKVGTGIYNVETCVADGRPYIMEVSPRGGGCKIAELQRLAYGVDLIENEIRMAVGMPLTGIHGSECDGVWCEMVVHSRSGNPGVLSGISIDKEVEEKYVKVQDLSVKAGDKIKPFSGANMSMGDVFLRFDSRQKLDEVIQHSKEWLDIKVKERAI